MRISMAGRTAVLCGAAALAACTDGPTGPLASRHTGGVSATLGTCGTFQQQAAQSMGEGYPLPTVTIIATISGMSGAPGWLVQRMNFAGGSGANLAPCLNSPDVTYTVDEAVGEQYDPLPVPDGVDPGFWGTLSPREQRALLKYARDYMAANPGRYTTPGQVITGVFRSIILAQKVDAKLTANDFFPGEPGKAELFAGGAYGASLYASLVQDPQWPLSNAETIRLVADVAAAWAEAQFATQPLRAAVFATNAAFGANVAAQNPGSPSFGWSLFEAVRAGKIKVSDPYETAGSPGGGSVPPGGGGGSAIPDWY